MNNSGLRKEVGTRKTEGRREGGKKEAIKERGREGNSERERVRVIVHTI